MALEEEKLSPEEKLLRVIQGGDKGKAPVPPPAEESVDEVAAPAPELPVAEPEAPTPEPVPEPEHEPEPAIEPVAASEPAPVEEPLESPVSDASAEPVSGVTVAGMPKLELVKKSEPEAQAPVVAEKKRPTGDTKRTDQSKQPKRGRPVAGPVKGAKKESRRDGAGLRVINKCLAAGILIVFLLTGWEILANVKMVEQSIGPALVELPEPDPLVSGQLVPLNDALDGVGRRPIFQPVKVIDPGPGRPVREPDLKSVGFLGISEVGGEQEAIVQDRESDKMLFLKVGATFTVKDTEFTVVAIETDRLRVTDGIREKEIR